MKKFMLGLVAGVSGLALLAAPASAQEAGWCSDKTIRVFSGGPAGGAFNSIIDRGALQAAEDTGANVQLIYSEWDFDKMVTQLREAISQRPDGIAMMGHPGNDAIMPLAAEAAAAGIPIMYMNVDVQVCAFGSGYVGATLYSKVGTSAKKHVSQVTVCARRQGHRDEPLESETRARRELGLVHVLEEAGMEVIKLQEAEALADQMLRCRSDVDRSVEPGNKLIGYPGGP